MSQCFEHARRLTLWKKVIKRWVTANNSANKNDRVMMRVSEKSSMLGLPKYFVGRNFDQQHHLIKWFRESHASKSPQNRKFDLLRSPEVMGCTPYVLATINYVLLKCCHNLSGTPLMMLILINSHLELKNGVSNVIIEDLIGGSQCCYFQQVF